MLISTAMAQTAVKALDCQDLGSFGDSFAISEADLRSVIQAKLQVLQASGAMAAHQGKIQARVRERVLEPQGVDLPAAQQNRSFWFDPSLVVKEDLKDHKGQIFHHKGEVLNPLEQLSFRVPWLFFDGACPRQRAFARARAERGPVTLIMTRGRPLDFMKHHGVTVYFDQRAWLTGRLKIKALPAEVSQDGKMLKIQEQALTRCDG